MDFPLMHRRKRTFLFTALLPFLVWSFLALAFLPGVATWLAMLLACTWGTVALVGLYGSRYSSRWLAISAAGVSLILLVHFTRFPNHAREWASDQDRTVQISFLDDEVRIAGLRNTTFEESGAVRSREWYSDSFRVNEVERVDFVHEMLSSNGLVAHGFLSFEFSDGRHLAVSIEARRRNGQTYSPVRGLFRNYELVYIMGPETDLIGMRANIRNNPVFVYPIRTSREQAQRLFQSILTRADQLARQPEFYNTITNNCVTSILLHVNQVAETPLRYDLRILVPGLADGLVHELGLLDFDGPRHEARPRFQINDRSKPFTEPHEWSKQLRTTSGTASR
jgi:hypothetical protein